MALAYIKKIICRGLSYKLVIENLLRMAVEERGGMTQLPNGSAATKPEEDG